MLRKALLGETSKALGPSTGTPPFAITGSQGTRRLNGATQGRYMQTYGGDEAIDWVMDCVDAYAQPGSNAQYWFHEPMDLGSNEGTVRPLPVESPPQDLLNLFSQPNPYMDYTELLELSIIDLLVAGEFFWLKYKRGNDPTDPQFGKPLGLYRLSPALVEIVLDENEKPKYVEWRAPGLNKDVVRFKPEDVVQVKRPNPHNQWRGMSVIASSPQAMDIELAITEAMRNYYDNGTWASGVLESDRTVPPSTWNKIKRQFRQLYQGKQSAGNVIMLERGLKYNPIAANANDAAYDTISRLSMDRIAKAFKVPLPLLGDVGGTDRLSVREAQRIFDNRVLRPFLNRIQKQVSLQLTQAWGLDYYIDYEYVMPIEDKLDLAVGASTVPGLMVKELRELVDKKPLEELGVENGKEKDETVLNLPPTQEELDAEAERQAKVAAVSHPPAGPGEPPPPGGGPPKPGAAPLRNDQAPTHGSGKPKVREQTKKSLPKDATTLRREIFEMRKRLAEVK